MRPLLLDEAAQAEVDRVIAFAMDHPYHPGRDPIPGDDPRFVANLSSYTAVFTFTHIEGKVFRHLTISIPRENRYPNPIAAFVIAEMFGFTGYDFKNHPDRPGRGWMIDVNKKENCVLVAQEAS